MAEGGAQVGEGESMSNRDIRAKIVREESREGDGEWLVANPRIMPKVVNSPLRSST